MAHFKAERSDASGVNNGISGVSIAPDGTVYISSFLRFFYALNPDGSLKWSYETGGPIYSTPVVAEDGTIFICSGDYASNSYSGPNHYYLYALNSDSTLKWRYETEGPVESSPAIATNGTIYIGDKYGNLYAINPDGTLKWKYKTESEIESSPVVSLEGTIYVGVWGNHLYAINPDGTLKWKFEGLKQEKGMTVVSSPAIAEDGTIYMGFWDDYLYAIGSK